MNSWNNVVFLQSIEEAFQNKDLETLEKLKEHFAFQIENVHNNRILNGWEFSPESKALIDELDELRQTIDERIKSIIV